MIKQTFRVSAINEAGEPTMHDFNSDDADAHSRAKAMFDANVQSGRWISVFLMTRVFGFAGGEFNDTGFTVVESFTK